MTDATTRDSFRADRAELRPELGREILAAVERLLVAQPYAEISVERLVEEAGISRSTFYNYFEDKGDLLRAMGADVMGQLSDAIRGWWDLPATATRDDLRQILGAMADTFEEHRALMNAVIETAPSDPRVRDMFDAVVADGSASVAAYIRQGQHEGHIDTALDPDRTGLWITMMIERGLHQLHGPDSAYDPERLIDALTTIIGKTLQP